MLTSFPSPALAFVLPLLVVFPGVAVVAVAVALNWGR